MALYFTKFSGATNIVALEDWERDYGKDLCESCANVAKTSHQDSRRNVWKLLPSFFGLPEWGELSKSDRLVSSLI